MYCFKTISELEESAKKIRKIINNPKSQQWDVKDAKLNLYECERQLKIKKKNERESNNASVFGSDDYVWVSNGDYSFYYWYEETDCPIKSHKNEDDCYEKDCDKRERCFTADYKGKEVVRLRASEISFWDESIEYILLLWISKYINKFLKNKSQK